MTMRSVIWWTIWGAYFASSWNETSLVRGAERFWVTPAGGIFGQTPATNWATTAGGAAGATVPGSADNAHFTLNGTYDVEFQTSTTNRLLNVDGGNVTFSMNNRTYTLGGAVAGIIGRNSGNTGRLTLRDGTLDFTSPTDTLIIGFDLNSTGSLTVNQQAAVGTAVPPAIVIGDTGNGTLTVSNGGTVLSTAGRIALGASSVGSATVSGISSTWNAGDLIVANLGQGTFNIQNGGTVAATSTTIGSQIQSVGIATVAGTGSSLSSAGTLTVGFAGAGTLSILSGGVVDTNGIGQIGTSPTSVGIVNVSSAGSRWTNTAATIGSAGEGWLNITNGGEVITTTNPSLVGNLATGSGRVLVTGEGSRWTLAHALTIGQNGTGRLDVTDGGRVATRESFLVGNGLTGVGVVNVAGAGSTIDGGNSFITVGGAGTGTLNVEDGGSVRTTRTFLIGDPGGSPIGTVNLRGGTISTGDFTKNGNFNFSDGVLSVAGTYNNGSAASSLTINGQTDADLPTLRLLSPFGVTNISTVTVGADQRGALEVLDGRVLNLGGNNLSIGLFAGGSGNVTVSGADAQIVSNAGTISVGGSAVAPGGEGRLTIGAGGTVSTNSAIALHPEGTIHLDGGTLNMRALISNGGRVDFSRGTIKFSSNDNILSASLVDTLFAGTREIGPNRRIVGGAGILSISSPLTLTGGTLTAETDGWIVNNNTLHVREGQLSVDTLGNNFGATIIASGMGRITTEVSFDNHGTLWLNNSLVPVVNNLLNNTGIIRGSGQILGTVNVTDTGQIQTTSSDRLQFGSSVTNSGSINAVGGEMQFRGAVTNVPATGGITARNAILRFDSGLANGGGMAVTFGTADIFGDVINAATGRVVVSGGSQATFYDDVVNNGTFNVSASGGLPSTAVFLGSLSGNGIAGAGRVFNEGDLRPGFSPGTMVFGGDLSFGPLASLEIEIGGTTPGTEFDQVKVANTVFLDGTLDVSFLGGFSPLAGQTFDIVNAAGGLSGTFQEVVAPAELPTTLLLEARYTPAVAQLVVLPSGDFNGSGSFKCDDIDALVATIASAVDSPEFDLNGDRVVDTNDLTTWLSRAGARNLASGNPYLLGDANLDGLVDDSDFAVWDANRFTATPAWCSGDFSADGLVDVSDFNVWNNNKFMSSSSNGVVPEPGCLFMALPMLLMFCCCRRK